MSHQGNANENNKIVLLHYPPEWLKWKQTIPSVDKDMEHLELSYRSDENIIRTKTVKNSLAIPAKVQHIYKLWLDNCCLDTYPTEMGTCVHQNICASMFT